MVINPDGTVQFEGDTSKLMPQRGVAAAAPDESVLRAAARNSGNPYVPSGPSNYVAPQPAPIMGAPSTVATPDNPAPQATAAAASKLSFGQRLLQTMRGVGSGIARGAGAVQAGYGVKQAVDGNYGGAVDNVFQGTATAINPVLGTAGNLLTGARDFVMRAAINHFIPGQNPNLYTPELSKMVAGGATAPGVSSGVQFPSGVNQPVGAAAAAAGGVLDSTAVPAAGTGVMRNNMTGRVTTFNTPPVAAGPRVTGAEAPATVKAPVLGTEGGLFANLVPFANARNQQMLEAATSGRDLNRAVKGASIAKIGIEGENATSNRITALARVQQALGAGKKLGYDASGAPVVVDTRTNTAVQPTIKKPVTEADIVATMAKNNLSRAEVVKRLKAEGKHDLSSLDGTE